MKKFNLQKEKEELLRYIENLNLAESFKMSDNQSDDDDFSCCDNDKPYVNYFEGIEATALYRKIGKIEAMVDSALEDAEDETLDKLTALREFLRNEF
jgi:trehalose-6-phosphatase